VSLILGLVTLGYLSALMWNVETSLSGLLPLVSMVSSGYCCRRAFVAEFNFGLTAIGVDGVFMLIATVGVFGLGDLVM